MRILLVESSKSVMYVPKSMIFSSKVFISINVIVNSFVSIFTINVIKTKKGPQEKKVVVVFSGVLVDFEEKEPKCGIYVGAGGLVVSISTSALILSGNS